VGTDPAPSLILCEALAPGGSELEPCARERGHNGAHYFWTAVSHEEGIGVQVYEGYADGLVSRAMMDATTPPESPKEVCVAMKLLDHEF
jgi:hypothetical protein